MVLVFGKALDLLTFKKEKRKRLYLSGILIETE